MAAYQFHCHFDWVAESWLSKWFDDRKGIWSVKLKLAKSTSKMEGPSSRLLHWGTRDVKVEDEQVIKLIQRNLQSLFSSLLLK